MYAGRRAPERRHNIARNNGCPGKERPDEAEDTWNNTLFRRGVFGTPPR